MRIRLSELREKEVVDVDGTEAWLSALYETFPVPEGAEKPLVKAHLVVERLPEEFARVTGQVEYAPYVGCSRCERLIPWPIKSQLEVFFQRDERGPSEGKEIALKRAELDEYYFVDGEFIDLEAVVNDIIQTAIPTRTLRFCADGRTCAVCGEDLESAQVYGTKSAPAASPFNTLKGFGRSK